MLIPPRYVFNPEITKHLQTIEAARSVIDVITIPPEIETNIRRQSVLKSSLYSARIEGNPLTLIEYTTAPSRDQKRIEIANILKGLQLVHERGSRDLTTRFIEDLHTKVMHGLSDIENTGKFRKEVSAIFNTAGIAIYMPPLPRAIPTLMERLIKFINNSKEPFIPVRAALAHYSFEKTHPFLDGNGRVGRLLLQAVLQKGGYGMKGLLSVEEYLDRHRSAYYSALEVGEKDITEYVEFILEAIAETANAARELVMTKQHVEAADYLLPRRAEILRLIEDQKLITFESIKRRFLKINDRTLRYDIKQLVDKGLVRKLGTTKGVFYESLKK